MTEILPQEVLSYRTTALVRNSKIGLLIIVYVGYVLFFVTEAPVVPKIHENNSAEDNLNDR